MPRIGCDRVKVATTRLSRGKYRLIMPRIGYDQHIRGGT
jgi:hypothetical protein